MYRHGCLHYALVATVDDGSFSPRLAGIVLVRPPDFTLATHSIARIWNEATLSRSVTTGHAPRTRLNGTPAPMADAWAAWGEDTIIGATWLLGNQQGLRCFEGAPKLTQQTESSTAVEHQLRVYRLLQHRFASAPRAERIATHIDSQMEILGHDTAWHATDYSTGTWMERAASLGNYLAEQYIAFGFQDGSFEVIDYQNTYYNPMNWNLVMDEPGNPNMFFPNRWQPLQLAEFIDQSGNEGSNMSPDFLSPEWGNVQPFAMTPADTVQFERLGSTYTVYHDPGPPAQIDPDEEVGLESDYKWGHTLVALWASTSTPPIP